MVAVRPAFEAVSGPTLILVAAALGVLVPAPNALSAATVPLVAFLVFCAVRGHDVASLRANGRLRVAVGALALVYLLPLAFAPVAAAFLAAHALVGVLVVTASPPTAGSAIVWTRRSGGDTLLTVLLAVAAIVAAPLVTPAVLVAVLGRGVHIDPLPLVTELLVVVGSGVVAARILPKGAVSDSTLNRLSLAAVGALIYVGTATTDVGSVAPARLATVALLAVGFLALTAGLAACSVPLVGRPRAASVFFTAGLRNLGVSVAVATTLHVTGAVVTVVVFYVTQQLVAALAATGISARARNATASRSA